jgi:hypothetical protein
MTTSSGKTGQQPDKSEQVDPAKRERLPISFIICGLEHSGTTLASDLFREHPQCESGFECGVLLCDSPFDFPNKHPFFKNLIEGWSIEEADLLAACKTGRASRFYEMLINHSRLFKDSDRNIVFDKTPRYITRVKEICKIFDIPIIAMIKDPRAIVASDFKRSGRGLSDIDTWYRSWAPGKLAYMRTADQGYRFLARSEQGIIIRLEDLCLDLRNTATKMFEHAGLSFEGRFLSLRRKRYQNTKNRGIDSSICAEWMHILPEEIISQVQKDFAEFTEWYYPFPA